MVIAERIGEGVFGVVYRASYEDVPVAVKEINPSLMEGADEFMIRALEKLTIREVRCCLCRRVRAFHPMSSVSGPLPLGHRCWVFEVAGYQLI